jgi:hypothetical protein
MAWRHTMSWLIDRCAAALHGHGKKWRSWGKFYALPWSFWVISMAIPGISWYSLVVLTCYSL